MPSRLTSYFNLSSRITPLHVVASLTSSALSISFLVFISSTTPFLLSNFSRIPPKEIGSIVARLVFVDELTALGLYLPIGTLMDLDSVGLKKVTSIGYLFVGTGLIGYVQSKEIWQLVLNRVVFAAGAAALVASISATLSSLTRVPKLNKTARSGRNNNHETSPLLQPEEEPVVVVVVENDKSGRLAGIIGFSSGLGALLAVFGYLRLPGFISNHLPTSRGDDDNLARGLVITFYLVAGIALLEGIFVFFALPRPLLPPLKRRRFSTSSTTSNTTTITRSVKGFKTVLKKLAKRLGMGFLIAKENQQVSLALLTSFATRAQAVLVTAMIPLIVNQYFLNHDLCSSSFSPPPSSSSNLQPPSTPTKHSCRQAYILSSILSGIVQLVTLVSSPLVGIFTSSSFLSSFFKNPQALVLAITFLLGTLSCIGFSTKLIKDPNSRLNWFFAIGLGICQASGTVISLSLLTQSRSMILSNIQQQQQEGEEEEEEGEEEISEIGGSLASAYSFTGGLGILTIGTLGGNLFDKWYEGGPFVLLAGVNLVVALSSLRILFRSRRNEPDEDER